MSQLRITNVSTEDLWLRDLYMTLRSGRPISVSRSPVEMGNMVGIQQMLAAGKLTVEIVPEAGELPNELIPAWPTGREACYVGGKVDAMVNKEGLREELPFNRYLVAPYGPRPFVGTAIVVAHDDEGETVGLSDVQVAHSLKAATL